MQYRPEIDGLRALAVVPVIAFHAGIPGFAGGFVGVDVFFVISGYLITSLMVTEQIKGRFSSRDFYERRARRILPALFLVMGSCVPFAMMWMAPGEAREFFKSFLSVTLFVSNIHFWLESGYFSTANELKPLLHAWSLSIEEQYYILFPVIFSLLWKLGGSRIGKILFGIAAVSLCLSQWGVLYKPSASFYLLPTRAWELLLGALCAVQEATRENKSAGHRRCNDHWAVLGIVLIGASVFGYDKNTPFPGFAALLPTVGAALVIQFARQETFSGALLSGRFFVGIGLLSYSAYLWHQPVFAFARLSSLDPVSSTFLGALIVPIFLMSYFSWRFVEQPFRSKTLISRKCLTVSALIGTACCIFAGVLGSHLKGPSGTQLGRRGDR